MTADQNREATRSIDKERKSTTGLRRQGSQMRQLLPVSYTPTPCCVNAALRSALCKAGDDKRKQKKDCAWDREWGLPILHLRTSWKEAFG